jgi:hypothetical protein
MLAMSDLSNQYKSCISKRISSLNPTVQRVDTCSKCGFADEKDPEEEAVIFILQGPTSIETAITDHFSALEERKKNCIK